MNPTPAAIENRYPDLAELAIAARSDPDSEVRLWTAIEAFILRGLYASAKGNALDVLLYMLDHGVGFTDACRALMFDSRKQGPLYSPYTQALKRFRRWCRSGARIKELQRSGLVDYYGDGLRGVTVGKFRSYNFTSSTERAAIDHIHRLEKIERLSSQIG
jgi:hypothetical protein